MKNTYDQKDKRCNRHKIILCHIIYSYLTNKIIKTAYLCLRRFNLAVSRAYFIAKRFLVLCERLDFFFGLKVVPRFAISGIIANLIYFGYQSSWTTSMAGFPVFTKVLNFATSLKPLGVR